MSGRALAATDVASVSALAASLRRGAGELDAAGAPDDLVAVVADLARALVLHRDRIERARLRQRSDLSPIGPEAMSAPAFATRATATLRRECERILRDPVLAAYAESRRSSSVTSYQSSSSSASAPAAPTCSDTTTERDTGPVNATR